MRKIAVVLLGIGLLMAGVSGAAEEQRPAQAAVEKERRRIVAANVQLTEAEGAKFWPVYKAYRAEKNQLLARSAKLLQQYRANAAKIDDTKALEMLRRMQRIREKEVELRRTYVDRFAKVLPTRKVLRYYQVENRLEAIARFESTRAIPLKR